MDVTKIDVATRLDLLDLPQKAADAVNRRDADQYADCFTLDAVWDPRPLGPNLIEGGRSVIRAAFLGFWETLDFALQGIYSVRIIECSGNKAKLRTYLAEYGRTKNPVQAPIGFGMYVDDCVLEDGVWRIAYHKLTPLYFGSPDFLHEIIPLPSN